MGNNAFDGMLQILQFQQNSQIMNNMMKMAVQPAKEDALRERTKTVMQTVRDIRKDDPSISFDEAKKMAIGMLDDIVEATSKN